MSEPDQNHNWVKEDQVRLVQDNSAGNLTIGTPSQIGEDGDKEALSHNAVGGEDSIGEISFAEGSVRLLPTRTSSLSRVSEEESVTASIVVTYRFSTVPSLSTIDEVASVCSVNEELALTPTATATTITNISRGGEEEKELRLQIVEGDLEGVMERKARVMRGVEELKAKMAELEEECKVTFEMKEEGGALEEKKREGAKVEGEKRRYSLRREMRRIWKMWRA